MADGLYFKLIFCSMKTTNQPLLLDKQSFMRWKILDRPTSIIWIVIFNCPFEYGDGVICKLLKWMQNLRQSTWEHNFLCWQIFRGWTTFNETTYARIQKYEHGGQLKIKINILFYGDNSWTVALQQINFFRLKDCSYNYKFYSNHYFLWASFWIWRYFVIWGYIGTNGELICVEFCNFVQCHVFVSL
jgi:hypothetical protein